MVGLDEFLLLWRTFEEHDLQVTIDGGWAVDAHLGRQTRPHDDLDIALPAPRVSELRALLTSQGFRTAHRADSWEHNFVLEHEDGRIVDVHAYLLDTNGENIGGVPYRAEHLCGKASIRRHDIRCVPPQWLVNFHSGYALDHDDCHDVLKLCKKFGLHVPDDIRATARRLGMTAEDGQIKKFSL